MNQKTAVIRTGGKQYLVQEGQEILIEKNPGKQGKKIVFEEVMLISDSGKVKIGQPLVKNANVAGEIKNQLKDKKIRVFKYKAKSRYRKAKGHRQNLTSVVIKKISSANREK